MGVGYAASRPCGVSKAVRLVSVIGLSLIVAGAKELGDFLQVGAGKDDYSSHPGCVLTS